MAFAWYGILITYCNFYSLQGMRNIFHQNTHNIELAKYSRWLFYLLTVERYEKPFPHLILPWKHARTRIIPRPYAVYPHQKLPQCRKVFWILYSEASSEGHWQKAYNYSQHHRTLSLTDIHCGPYIFFCGSYMKFTFFVMHNVTGHSECVSFEIRRS
jgi:hypothetical protein